MKYLVVLITAALLAGCGGEEVSEETRQSIIDEALETTTTASTTTTSTTTTSTTATTTTAPTTTTSTVVPPSGICSKLSSNSVLWGSEIVETIDNQMRDYFNATGLERVPPEFVAQVWAEGYAEVIQGCSQAEAEFIKMAELNGHPVPR